MNCPICKKELESNLSFCPYCGTPITEENGEYVKGPFIINKESSSKKNKDRARQKYVEKNRTIAGICSIISFPLMLGALIFMLFTFITFNPGTAQEMSGIKLVPYSICFLVPSFAAAVFAFFKARDIDFKQASRLATIAIIIDGILTMFGFVILMLITSSVI